MKLDKLVDEGIAKFYVLFPVDSERYELITALNAPNGSRTDYQNKVITDTEGNLRLFLGYMCEICYRSVKEWAIEQALVGDDPDRLAQAVLWGNPDETGSDRNSVFAEVVELVLAASDPSRKH